MYPKYNSIRQEQKEQLKREIDFIKLKNKAYERNKQRIKEEEKTNETNALENVMSFSPPPLFAPVATRPTPKLRINPYPGNPGGKGKTHKKKSHKNIGKSKKEGYYINIVLSVSREFNKLVNIDSTIHFILIDIYIKR